MRAKLIVFPIRARNWCFTRSIDHSLPPPPSSSASSFKELWNNINNAEKSFNAKAELCTDYVADKMNNGWVTLEKAPDGSLKKKIHGLGLWLLSRVKPSEIFLKSISKEVTGVEIVYPSRGTTVHRKFFYGSVSLIPLSSALSILPLPNVAFFWILYRSYSHWRALQGSEKLFQLVSNSSNSSITFTDKKGTEHSDSQSESLSSDKPHCILSPSEELEKLVHQEDGNDGLSRDTITEICKLYNLNTKDVIKYEKSIF
ncbi:uncharacterized protein LOC127076188 isoform X2 [Lathyrus oleraceus]|uniref:uncharacterized protein LOC127076188 isoform X2 n=1 Tax=Pisum sativum TaxID=3888 RepID=UPI0021D2ACCC|nr:uncharacterized protein LOC127076188 isoform X2 [Pisum sativum]